MNAERLLALYDRVAEAPDAVPRLRRFVLDLAVRGRLVEQDPADEPAMELLKRIAAKKKARRMMANKRGKNAAIEPEIAETPYDLPANWVWVSIGTAFIYDAGIKREPGELDSSFWLLELEDIEKNTGRLISRVRSEKRNSKSTKSEFQSGDILYGKLRPYLNKVLVADEAGYSTTEIVAIRPYVPLCSEYCAMALRRPDFVKYVAKLGKGTKMPRLRTQDAIVAPFPLPSLAEQRRIVAKVDELMALCDQLEQGQAVRENGRDRLTKVSYASLNASDADAATFSSHARFAVNMLPALTARADQIKRLRQTILSLAVRGKLVKQNPADEPAMELLKRIAAKKAQLVKAGEIRKSRYPISSDRDKTPFPLPRGWTWAQVAKLGVISPRNNFPDDHRASFVPMPMIPQKYGAANDHEIRLWGEIRKGYTHFANGDVGLAKITPCFENGKSVVFRNLTGGIGSGTTELHVVRPIFVNADYIVLFLKGPFFIETGIPKMTGTAGQKRVPTEYFANSLFPLPPLAEQRRIVAMVDELMGLCDRLQASLNATDAGRHCLLESLLREALAQAA